MTPQTPFDAVPARDRMGLPLRSLTADVAHELSNQLGCLVLLPDLMLNSLSPDSPLAKDLIQIRRAAHRIDELATHLALLSQDTDEREIVNLNRAAQHALDDESLTALLKDAGGAVMSRWNEQVCPVLGSTDWVALMAGVLVRNALDAKPGGCATLSTELRTLPEIIDGWEPIPAGVYAVLTASDDGPPLSALQKEKLFEPYFTHSLGRKSTSGLGLAVVRQLARRMGAFIHVRSVETGNRVDIYFPAAGTARDSPTRVPPCPPVRRGPIARGSRRGDCRSRPRRTRPARPAGRCGTPAPRVPPRMAAIAGRSSGFPWRRTRVRRVAAWRSRCHRRCRGRVSGHAGLRAWRPAARCSARRSRTAPPPTRRR